MSEIEKDTEQQTEVTKAEKKSTKKVQGTEVKEKYVTKYDRKMQKREEEKKKREKEDRVSRVIGILVVLVLICLVAYFPIRNYLSINGTYIKVGGESVSRVEYDYNYSATVNNYMNQYGSFLTYMGLDTSSDFSMQMYSNTMTWKDYFDQMTVESIVTEKALAAEAKAAGFTYDTTEEYQVYVDSMKQAAANKGVNTKTYIQQTYGDYATLGRIQKYIENAIYTNAYYSHVSEEKAPTDAEILAYYEENKDDYDSVDYYMTVIDAQLPTEPTELADPVEGSDEEATDSAESTTYQPSEAEIEKAMADARELADAAEATVAEDGELQENVLRTSATYVVRDWLFDENRQEGDTTVIEDSTSYRYYVLSFVKRYRDDAPAAADIRIISVGENDGQAILDEWKSGEATEESFAALADKYNEGTSFTAEGGLYEGVTVSGTQSDLSAWIFQEARTAGDTAYIDTEEGYSYVVYFIALGDAQWQIDIADTLLDETMTEYLDSISEPIQVEDPKENLNYLKALAQEEALQDALSQTEVTGDADGTGEEADTVE